MRRFLASLMAVWLCVCVVAAQGPLIYPDKSAHRPTPIPDRIILTWSAEPTTTQSVTWRTDTTVVAGVGQVAKSDGGPGFDSGPGKPPSAKTRQIPAETKSLSSDLGVAHYHSVTFGGLEPGTRYVYRVGDGANWSEWFQFQTASDKPEPFGFIYFGDAQNDLKRHWSRVIRGAYSDMPEARFILHAGDLVNSGSRDAEWGEWFDAGGWINGMVPSVPVPGNHEYTGKKPNPAAIALTSTDQKEIKPLPAITPHWQAQFTLPRNGPPGQDGLTYTFDYQGVRFVCLNSNEAIREQVPWLESVLQNNPNRWTVVSFHHPVYSTAKGRDNKHIRDAWRPVFDKYAVDLVLQGHDHGYGRSGIMQGDNLLTGASTQSAAGTVYVVSVSGPKLYSVEERDWMVSRLKDQQLYQLIRIDGDRLHYEARTATGDLHDEFELRKGRGVSTLVEGPALRAEAHSLAPSWRDTAFALGGMGGLVVGSFVVRRLRRKRSVAIT